MKDVLRKVSRLAGLALLVGAATACEDDPPIPSGNVLRPAGLAFVPRTSRTTENIALRRSDLFVADSEAQGVRIVQFDEAIDRNDQGEARRAQLTPFFVPAPVVFFKLTVEAPGFPTRLAVTPDFEDVPRLAFVVSPAEAAFHVLEVEETPYRAPSNTSTNFTSSSVDLLALLPDLGELRIPVDVVYMGLDRARTAFRVGIAFDGLGTTTDGALVILGVSTEAPHNVTSVLARMDVPAGIRDIEYIPNARQILVASVGTSSVTVVRHSPAIENDIVRLQSPEFIDAGGPVRSLVSTVDLGVLGLRFDIPALVWLERTLDGFARSERILSSPYDEESPELAGQPGVLLTRDSPVVAAASARRTSLPTPAGVTVFEGDELRDVLLLAHQDGLASFVVEEEGRPVIGQDGDPSEIFYAFSTDLTEPGDEPLLMIEDCELPGLMCIPAEAEDEAICAPPNFEARPVPSIETNLRVEPHGLLVTGLVPPVEIGTVAAAASDMAATTTVTATISDRRFEDFSAFQVRVGDEVRLGVELNDCPNSGDETGFVLTGRVLEEIPNDDPRTVEARIRVELYIPLPSDTPVAGDGAEDDPSASNAELVVPEGPCQTAFEELELARNYEVRIPQDLNEAALTGVQGQRPVVVYERAPMVNRRGGNDERFVDIQFGGPEPNQSPINLSVRSAFVPASEDPLAQLDCELRFVEDDDLDEDLNRCVNEADCSFGRICNGASGRCPGSCSDVCLDPACFDAESARVCPQLGLQISPSLPVVIDLRSIAENLDGSRVSASAPSDAVYHEFRESFFISFAGSGTLIEVPVRSEGQLIQRTD